MNDTVWATLKPSPIHGIGVFAIRDIPKGQKVYARGTHEGLLFAPIDRLLPEIQDIIRQRWPLVDIGQPYMSPNEDVRLISFMNHSDTPNYDKYTDSVFFDVPKGTELTENYAPEAVHIWG